MGFRDLKNLGVLALAAAFFFMAPLPAHAQMRGDADMDGVVGVSDGVNALRAAAGLASSCTLCDMRHGWQWHDHDHGWRQRLAHCGGLVSGVELPRESSEGWIPRYGGSDRRVRSRYCCSAIQRSWRIDDPLRSSSPREQSQTVELSADLAISMTTLGRVADGTIVGRLDGSSVFELSYIGLALDKTMLGGRAAGSVIAFPGINPANGFTDIGFARIAAFKMFGDGSNELILQLDLATGRLSAT